jgi:hypothetical protein
VKNVLKANARSKFTITVARIKELWSYVKGRFEESHLISHAAFAQRT